MKIAKHAVWMFVSCALGTAYAQDVSQLKPTTEAPNKAAVAQVQVVSPQAAAPALTSMAIYAVGSTQYGGYEYTYGLYSTAADHGGAQLRVAVEEWGYGQGRIATINGATLPSSANYLSQPICGGTPANPTLNCPAGSTAIGYMQYWNLDGYQSGNFYSQATTINGTTGTKSASISIK